MLMTSKCYITATIKQRKPRGVVRRRVTVCEQANTSLPSSSISLRNQRGHLGLALKLHSSPEMDSSGGQNQILICKRGVGWGGGLERARECELEVPGNANLWVNPTHLIVLLFVCDIDSSGGDYLSHPAPVLHFAFCLYSLFYRWTGPLLTSQFSLGFNPALHQRRQRGVIICNVRQ